MSKKVLLTMLVAMLCFSVACADGKGGSEGTGEIKKAEEGVTLPAPKEKAKDFTLRGLEDTDVTLAGFEGKKVVLLVFWATWCPPCRREVPELIKLKEEIDSSIFEIVAVSVDEKRDVLPKFMKENKINYTVLHDEGGEVAIMYEVRGIPYNLLIDKKGMVLYKDHPLPKKLKAMVEKLAKQ